jgi:hypothetical protein
MTEISQDEADVEEAVGEQYLLASGNWEKLTGYAIQELDFTADIEERFYVGKTLEDALEGFWRAVTWWSYKPSDGKQVYEDVWDAVEYEEENSNITFEKFADTISKMKKLPKSGGRYMMIE